METRAVEEIVIEEVDILDRMRKLKAVDNKIVKVVEEMKKANVKVLRNEEWREEDGLMLKDGKVYVPKDEELRAECHEPPLWLSPFLLFFSLLFYFLFIAWESLSHYVTQVVTMSHHGHITVTVTNHVTWSHGRVGK